jgi:squalene/oxidosqualene cyclase-like protein
MFLMPGAIIVMYVTKTAFTPEQTKEMIKYLFNHQLADGGWGIHIENGSTMFGTVLTYISLRLLGVEPTDSRLVSAHKFIQQQGGAMFAPSWAKFWLCVLGVMPWEGVNSLFPELWMLPKWAPFHPWRWWCHCRMVYLPMSYCYANRVTGEITPLIQQLRKELYTTDYSEIDFTKHRDSIAKIDLYTPQTSILKVLNFFTNSYERLHSSFLRRRASQWLLRYIDAEDAQTNYIDIGPVNKFVNMLSIWHGKGPQSKEFKLHAGRVNDYLWVSEDGMKVQGYNGSQLWDTAFAVQAINSTGFSHLFSSTLALSYSYLEVSQVLEDVEHREEFFRHISKGGWPFSTRDHGWPITDCTAEGLKATLELHQLSSTALPGPRKITEQRLADAVNVILSFQNPNGGWSTYELQRAGGWMEYINPAEVFGGIMVDYPYVECSSACVQSLCSFRKAYPGTRTAEIDRSINQGVNYIKSIQRSDGSWAGSWAVCFTYGTWFGLEALLQAGESLNSPIIKRAVAFLLSKQNADGGWGESYLCCVKKEYVAHEKSQSVNTAWAAISLINTRAEKSAIDRAIRYLVNEQRKNGDWAQEAISGVFNGNCMISYSNYRNIFPIWALGKYIQYCKELQSQ